MSKEKKFIDNVEMDAAEAAAEAEILGNVYVHTMSRPFEYEGKKYEKLTFDWEKLTGIDSLAIESELTSLGKAVVVPEFSGDYLIRMAAKACTEPVGSDVLQAMPLPDFNKIRNHARSFLLKSAQ